MSKTPRDEPEFMDAAALIGREALDDLSAGKPISSDTNRIVSNKSTSDLEKEQSIISGLMAATLAASKTKASLQAMHKEIIQDSHMSSISIDDLERYLDMLSRRSYRGAQMLYITVSAVFTQVLHDLGLDPLYDHIHIVKKKRNMIGYHTDKKIENTKPATTHDYYMNHLTTAICAYYIGYRDLNTEVFAEIYAPSLAQLEEEDKSFASKFILISLALLTNTYSFMKLIDNTRVNDWCETSHLTKDSDSEEVLRAAASYFSHKE